MILFKELFEKNIPFEVIDIEGKTENNKFFREVLWTGENTQLTVMSVKDEIGMETHPDTEQFIRVEEGKGKVVVNGEWTVISSGDAFIIPKGYEHNVINTGKDDLKIYTVYAPPHHPKGQIDKTKEDADKRG